MNDDRRKIDLDKWLRSRVKILNDSGGRGFDTGVRTFNCPLCRDTKGRGWVGLAYWQVGCFNIGCVASPRLEGGALELARRLEGLRMRADTFLLLKNNFGTASPIVYTPVVTKGDDYVRLPREMRPFDGKGGPWERTYLRFVEKQWSISEADARAWGLGYCVAGYYAGRVIIPITMFGAPVAFQARIVGDGKPKYLTSRHGPAEDPKAECFRSAADILVNYDRLPEGGDALLVEGVGDVMGWHRGDLGRSPVALGLLGLSLTPGKLVLLSDRRPGRVILAPDAEVSSTRLLAALRDIRDKLTAWDMPVVTGTWVGGKDAGSGATLVY